jgi:hypothetical protein
MGALLGSTTCHGCSLTISKKVYTDVSNLTALHHLGGSVSDFQIPRT